MSTSLTIESSQSCATKGFGPWGILGRGLLIAAVMLWAWFLAARMRTAQFGFSGSGLAAELAMVTLLAGPVAWIPFLGWSLRRLIWGTVGLLAVAVVLAEAYAAAEEALVRRRFGVEPEQRTTTDRAWPFQGNGIVYEPGQGWSAHD